MQFPGAGFCSDVVRQLKAPGIWMAPLGLESGELTTSEKVEGRKTTMMQRWEQLVPFLKEVRAELKKVNWPARKEVVGSTVVVIVSVFILSFFLGAVDFTLQKLLTLVVR